MNEKGVMAEIFCCCSRSACGLVGISCGGYSGIICAAELTLIIFFSRLWACGYFGLNSYSRRACGLVGVVGLFSTGLWACRYIVRRLFG